MQRSAVVAISVDGIELSWAEIGIAVTFLLPVIVAIIAVGRWLAGRIDRNIQATFNEYIASTFMTFREMEQTATKATDQIAELQRKSETEIAALRVSTEASIQEALKSAVDQMNALARQAESNAKVIEEVREEAASARVAIAPILRRQISNATITLDQINRQRVDARARRIRTGRLDMTYADQTEREKREQERQAIHTEMAKLELDKAMVAQFRDELERQLAEIEASDESTESAPTTDKSPEPYLVADDTEG